MQKIKKSKDYYRKRLKVLEKAGYVKRENTYLGRKYIGELQILQDKYIVYYISNRNNPLYVRQTLTDINKMFSNDKVIVFLENFERMNKRNKYFTISGKSIQVINPTDDNLELIKNIKDIDSYDIIREIYKGKEILLSNWNKADFMTEGKRYIVFMPFIDIGKLHKLNIASGDNKESKRNIDILTLKGNRSKTNEILVKPTNIIEIDRCLDKVRNESMLCE